MFADQCALFFACIAYGPDDTQQIDTYDGLFVVELLGSPREEVRVCQSRSNERRESQELLQRFKEIFKGISFRSQKAMGDRGAERSR